MEVGEESVEKTPSPRARCNTWHAGLEDVGEAPATSDHSFVLAVRGGAAAAGVKRSARRNAWGTASYADLIAAAIESSPDKRLTLSEIYDWMVTNVKYFSDRADNSSSAGWKNSIRHNLSLHKRFVRVPHTHDKSSWWTVNPSEPSSVRWLRGSNSVRHRADSIDTRSYVLQRQRRNRKSTPDSSTDSIRKSNTRTVPLSSACFETVEEANSDTLKLFSGQEFFISCSDSAVFPSAAPSDSLCNMDAFTTRSIFSDINSTLSTPPSAFLGADRRTNSEELSSFRSKVSSILEPSFESSAFAEDDYSNVMVTQLSPLAWNQLEIGVTDLLADDTDTAAASIPEGRRLSLFSDDSMLTASQLTDSSLEDPPVFCDDRELMLAAYSTVSSSSDQPSYRRGSDAPPPSPESNCGEQSSSFEETVGSLAEMKVEASAAASAAPGGSTQFATGWTSVFPLKTEDVSSLSDVDMEH